MRQSWLSPSAEPRPADEKGIGVFAIEDIEAGTTVAAFGGLVVDGAELRALVTVPNAAARNFFYGVNFAVDLNERHWSETAVTSELRPILGWRFGPVDLVFNPILETAYEGWDHIEFAPNRL